MTRVTSYVSRTFVVRFVRIDFRNDDELLDKSETNFFTILNTPTLEVNFFPNFFPRVTPLAITPRRAIMPPNGLRQLINYLTYNLLTPRVYDGFAKTVWKEVTSGKARFPAHCIEDVW